ncbi:DUF4198 domain-containing protein [Rosistilla oblonga]|uniref:Nickel uptake substrate-specific transmembrane region n=1 Tax=Rosistilla oblonga TaxID=2527990 RepID=A0A518J205_9BACT|nr:DUF4198 domain-containing protein [Rosistilla oblonga]QDV59367.1 hypothetical protein Mal33_53950 [Rosistilla oblonga]
MRNLITTLRLALCSLPLLVGCGQQQFPGEQPVFPIEGVVTVDGKPVENIQIALHPAGDLNAEKPFYPQGFTDAEGNVKVSTYADGDGAPAGDYRVTFVLKEYNLLSRSFTGPNRLSAQYADSAKTPITLSVGPDQSNDLGKLDFESN